MTIFNLIGEYSNSLGASLPDGGRVEDFAALFTLRFRQVSCLRSDAVPRRRKYAALSSLGNVPVVYMTAVDDWMHDCLGTGWMLQIDALSAILLVVAALFLLHQDQCPEGSGSRGGQQSRRLELHERGDSAF